jgi:DNA-binding IclR family transcriptional regulator
MTNGNKADQPVPAVEKTLNIFEYLAEKGIAVPIKQISSELGIPLVTTYRIVGYLTSRGYLREEQPGGGQYCLGMRLLYLAQSLTAQMSLVPVAAPHLRVLAQETGHTAQLGVLQDHGVIYIDHARPTRPVSITATIGSILPINVSAAGKVLVAHLPPAEQQRFLEHADLPQQTERSITDRALLLEELAKVKAQGYASDCEEYARGIGCLAAPIHDHTGRVIAAVGITGHIASYMGPQLQSLLNAVFCAAGNISGGMGHEIR